MSDIKWTRENNGIRISYTGSNGAVIIRRSIGSKLYHGRDRQHSKGSYYTYNGLPYYSLKDAKQAVADEIAGVVRVYAVGKRS